MSRELELVLDELRQALSADLIVLHQYEPSTRDVLVPPYISGELRDSHFMKELSRSRPPEDTTVWQLLHRRQPFFAADATRDWAIDGFQHGSFIHRESIASSAGIPLITNNELLGVLFINFRRQFEFTESVRSITLDFAAQASSALKNLRLLAAEVRLTNHAPILVRSIVLFGHRTPEGQIIEGVGLPWRQIVKKLDVDPDFLSQISWRELEELIAGAYKASGWGQVVLTPRSGDRGRDIIASANRLTNIRVVDQVKAYKKERVVSADEVRSMLGVLTAEGNVSKGFVTTTSVFAPGIQDEPTLQQFIPYRLELRNGLQLITWLVQIAV